MMTMKVAEAPWLVEFEKVEPRLTSGHWSDCTFVVGSAEPNQAVVPAHKLILAMASSRFEEMFYGLHSEYNKPMIPIADVKPDVFRALIKYIYTGKIDKNSFEMAKELWLAAKKYKLPHLEKKCKSIVCSVVGPRNALPVYEFASQIKEKTLMDICIQIISANTKEILNDGGFVGAKIDTVLTVLSLDQLNVDNELDLFGAVVKFDEARTTPGQSSPSSESADGGPPAEEQSESVDAPISEDKASVLNGESSSQSTPAVELDPKEPSEEVVTSEPPADSGNLEEVTKRDEAQGTPGRSSSPADRADGRPPAGKLSESVEPPISEDKASVLNGESSSLNSPAVEQDSKEPSEEKEQSEPPADSGNSEVGVGIQEALKKIRFLSLNAAQFAEGPGSSTLLTLDQKYALLMNISLEDIIITMPTGFSASWQRRQLNNMVEQDPFAKSHLKASTESRGASKGLPTSTAIILQDLESPDQDKLKVAARAARIMTAGDASTEVRKLVKGGVVPLLVTVLNQLWTGVQYDAAWALTNIAQEHKYTKAVFESGAVPKLLSLLDRGDDLSEQATLAIGNIAHTNRSALLNGGVITALVTLMTPTPSRQLVNCLWTYSIICERETQFSLTAPALPFIKKLLLLKDEEVLVEACSILFYMTDELHQKSCCFNAKLFTPELTTPLTDLLGNPSPRVQTAALKALENMMAIDELNDQCLVGFLDHIIDLLKCGNPSLVEDAARAVADLFKGEPLRIKQALDRGILDALVPALTNGNERCKAQTVIAVSAVCSKCSSSQLRELAYGAALEPYCQLLADTANSYDVLQGLTNLLQNIEQNARDVLCLKLLEFEVPKLLISLQEHEDELIRERADHLLKTYFADDIKEKGRL